MSETKRKQFFNQMVNEFRNPGKTTGYATNGANVYLGASSTNVAAYSSSGGANTKAKKSQSIDKKGATQVQIDLKKQIPTKKGRTYT